MTRKSKRELEREVADLASDKIPDAGITTIFSAERFEPVDPDRRIYRIDGEVMRVHPAFIKLALRFA